MPRAESVVWPREPLDDVFYLPPVADAFRQQRRELATRMTDAGTPVVVQHLPNEAPMVEGPAAVYDLLEALLARDYDALAGVPAGATAIWPLIGGYTDDASSWQTGLGHLADAGVGCVQGIAADLSPGDRRRLVNEAGEAGFEALFHGPVPSERRFAQAVADFGLAAFADRPLPSTSAALRGNRRLAALLATIGELWLRLRRGEARGQAYYRAARWIDRESHDLWTLGREGNLGVVTWLDGPSRSLLEGFVSTGECPLLEQLRRDYLTPVPDGDED